MQLATGPVESQSSGQATDGSEGGSPSALKLFACLAAIQCFAFPSNAHAYLDPGTGSIILQGVLAAFIAGGMYLRTIRMKIVSFFRFSRKPAKPAATDARKAGE